MRTSEWRVRTSPTRSNVPSCSTRSSLPCRSSGSSPISSRNSVPPAAASKRPDAIARRARERAAHVAEELALRQLARDGGAVDLDERAGRAAALLVDGLRRQLLAGARFAQHQHGGVGGGDGGDLAQHRAQLGAAADQRHRLRLGAAAQDLVLQRQPAPHRLDLGERARGRDRRRRVVGDDAQHVDRGRRQRRAHEHAQHAQQLAARHQRQPREAGDAFGAHPLGVADLGDRAPDRSPAPARAWRRPRRP